MRRYLLGAVVAGVLAACGGGGGGGTPAPVVAGGGGQGNGQGNGEGGGGGGGGGGGPSGPGPVIPPVVVPEAPPPSVQVSCVHGNLPQTAEYNVGGPAGTPNRKEEIADVPWEALNPGDTVRIHWRAQPYAARIALFRSGTAAKPVRVCGVAGGAGNSQRPHITGIDAVTRQSPEHRSGPPASDAPRSIVSISAQDFESRVEHVVLEGLRIGDTKGDGAAVPINQDARYFDAGGVRRTYNADAACIRVRLAKNITIRGNEIVNCADGIFAASTQEDENFVVRNLVVEGNYLHGSGVIGNQNRHQAYLQGTDITVQLNYFGPSRTNAGGTAAGNQLKTRAAGLIVRYNYIRNGARTLDIVEAEEHIVWIAPWRYARHRQEVLIGELGRDAAQLAEHDARQQDSWAKYQAAYVYGNLLHVQGGLPASQDRVPPNLVHYGFDNTQHDRQPGTLWFFHNTVLWETNRNSIATVRLFDYGSNAGDGDFYFYDPALTNVGNALHYLTDAGGETCQAPNPGCTDWGPMLQHREDQFGRMRAFNNALVRTSATQNEEVSRFELTRHLFDRLEITGPMWITQGWDAGGGTGKETIDTAYPGGNAAHHVTGVVPNVVTGADLPISKATFGPVAGSPLFNAAGAWPAGLAESLKPQFSVTLDAAQPGRLVVAPRTVLSTIGAVQ